MNTENSGGDQEPEPSARRLRHRRETRARLEEASLRLFAEQGFEETTVQELAEAAGIGRRTFFRYFHSKNDIVFGEFAERGESAAAALDAAAAAGATPIEMVHRAFLAANTYDSDEYVSLAIRIWLITSVPSLQAHAAIVYRSWERMLADRLAVHMGGNRLYADALARVSIAAMWAAYDAWLETRATTPLAECIDAVFTALTCGFVEE